MALFSVLAPIYEINTPISITGASYGTCIYGNWSIYIFYEKRNKHVAIVMASEESPKLYGNILSANDTESILTCK